MDENYPHDDNIIYHDEPTYNDDAVYENIADNPAYQTDSGDVYADNAEQTYHDQPYTDEVIDHDEDGLMYDGDPYLESGYTQGYAYAAPVADDYDAVVYDYAGDAYVYTDSDMEQPAEHDYHDEDVHAYGHGYDIALEVGTLSRSRANRFVTFNANGGLISGPIQNPRTVSQGGRMGSLPVVTRANHSFVGWFTATVGGSQVTANTVVNGNITVFARWNAQVQTVNRTVSFNANGGAPSASRTVQNGRPLGFLPANPSRSGHTFAGWFTSATGGSRVTTSTIINANITFWARWNIQVQNVTVTFNPNGGAFMQTQVTLQRGTPLRHFPPANRPGHRLIGWFTAATGGTQIQTTTPIQANMTLFARWQAIPLPVITAPSRNGLGVPHADLTIAWNAVPGARYQLSLRNLNTNGLVINGQTVNGTSFRVTRTHLTPGHRFRIAVGATEPGGQTLWYEREFVVSAPDVMRFYMNQSEEPFASMPFGDTTIEVHGCGILSVAMIICRRENITTLSGKQGVIREIIRHGLSGNLLRHSFTVTVHGRSYSVRRGDSRPANFNDTIIQYPSHFVVAVNNDLVKDPGARAVTTVAAADRRWGTQRAWWSVN